MKKAYFLSFTFFFLLSFGLHSQPVIFLGLKGGTLKSTALVQGAVGEINPKFTFDVGFISEFSFISKKTEELSRGTLIAELNYSKNYYHNNTSRGVEFSNNFDVSLYYAQVPIMFRFYTGFLGVKKTGFYANLGAYAAYLFKAEHKGEQTILQNVEQIHENVLSDYLVYDYGVSFGGGLSMAGFIGVDFRYNIGIPNISKLDNLNIRNKNWGVFLHLALPINYHEEY
jgi:hypothetical protein